nr:basic proline-rich protein-like [Procambarus clarkii]
MQIFCRETEAHLQMHPHLNDLKPASSSGLITPDLWLRDCGGQSNETDSLPESEVKVDSPSSPQPPTTTPPMPSPDPTEPVNLTTTQSSSRSEHRSSPLLSRGSPVTVRQGPSRSVETRSPGPPPPTPRYGRPRLRDRREGARELGRSRTVRASLQLSRAGHSDADRADEPVRMPTIRVRQLESQQQQQDQMSGEREIGSNSEVGGEGNRAVSPHPSAQPPGLPLGGLGGGLGSLLPMVGGAPLLLPHMLPPDLPRTPLLPHLLLQRPELLRPPPLRHPLLQGHPAPAPPTPTPHTAVPPPLPGPPKTQGSLLPPITVLLPCPLPIPIPIPIPVPIPIPYIPRNDMPEARQPPQREPPGRPRTTPRKEACRTGSVINGPVAVPTSSGSVLQSCSGPVAPPPPPTSSSSSDGERSTHPRPDRERRSILRYTSDVYEINGMFVPRDSTWDSPEPLQLRRALVGDPSHESPYDHHHEFDSRDVSRSPSPDASEDNKDALVNLTRKREEETSTVKRLLGDDDEEEEETKSVDVSEAEGSPASTAPSTAQGATTRKRHTAGDHHQPLPKKKHLLV